MKSDVQGCSTCPPSEERMEWFHTKTGSAWSEFEPSKMRLQYDFRTLDGLLFSGVFETPMEARQKRDEWLLEQGYSLEDVRRIPVVPHAWCGYTRAAK